MKKTKLIITMIIILTMLISIVPFGAFKSFAANTVKIQLNQVIDFANGAAGNASLKCNDDGSNTVEVNATGQTFNISQENHVDQQNNVVSSYFLEVDEGSTITFTFSSANASIFVGGTEHELDANNSYELTATSSGIVDFIFNSQPAPGPGDGEGEGDNQQGGPDDIEIDAEFTGTHMNMWINNKVVMTDEVEMQDTFKGIVQQAGISDSESNFTNVLRFIQPYGDAPVAEFIINGILYTRENDNVQIENDEWFITVPAAPKYTIRGEADNTAEVPRTIIWTNPNYVPKDEADARWVEGFSLDHGYAYIIAIYNENGESIDKKDWKGSLSEDGFGHFEIKPGSRVIFEFFPEYGYQLTDIRINEQKLGLTGLANQFEFKMPDTNIHFDAEFTKTEDVVKANSEKVSSGTVSLGENKLSGGTAQLMVNDVELSSDKIAGFENAAGDYTISNYLDIDLYQVYYKGKNDSDDVWSTKISELDKEATITIKLEDGISADDIVIVHNIHDGEKYEIIEIESYDEATNTITFKTKSFSNYAIASKESAEKTESKEENNPQTGDMIKNTFIVLSIACITLILTFKFKKNYIRKH